MKNEVFLHNVIQLIKFLAIKCIIWVSWKCLGVATHTVKTIASTRKLVQEKSLPKAWKSELTFLSTNWQASSFKAGSAMSVSQTTCSRINPICIQNVHLPFPSSSDILKHALLVLCVTVASSSLPVTCNVELWRPETTDTATTDSVSQHEAQVFLENLQRIQSYGLRTHPSATYIRRKQFTFYVNGSMCYKKVSIPLLTMGCWRVYTFTGDLPGPLRLIHACRLVANTLAQHLLSVSHRNVFVILSK